MKPRFGELTVILRVCSSTRTCKHVVALFESCCLQQCWPSKEPPHVAALGVGKRREAIRKDKKRRLTALEKEAPPFTYLQLVDDMWGDPRERLATAIAGPATWRARPADSRFWRRNLFIQPLPWPSVFSKRRRSENEMRNARRRQKQMRQRRRGRPGNARLRLRLGQQNEPGRRLRLPRGRQATFLLPYE